MDCPTCGGPVWNNAQKNVQRAAEGKKPLPLWACKDKDGCGWVKWPPKGSGANTGGGSGNGNRGQVAPNGAGPRNSRPLGPLYFTAMKIAKATLDAHMGKGAYTAADLHAATATLFIGATNTGAPLTAPPKPKPEPEPEYEDEGDYSDENAIPF